MELKNPIARAAAIEKLAGNILEGLAERRVVQTKDGPKTMSMISTWLRDKPEGWILADGKTWAPVYVNLRPLASAAPYLYRGPTTDALILLLRDMDFIDIEGRPRPHHKIVGLAMAGIPLGAALTVETGIPSLYTRKVNDEVKTDKAFEEAVKAWGGHSLVEGVMEDGDVLAIVDDLTTKFFSKRIGLRQISLQAERSGVRVEVPFVLTVLDREQGAAAEAAEDGIEIRSAIKFVSKGLKQLEELDVWSAQETATIRDYFADPSKFQAPEVREELKNLALNARRVDAAISAAV